MKLTGTTFTLLGAITALKQNQIKFRQQIPPRIPWQPLSSCSACRVHGRHSAAALRVLAQPTQKTVSDTTKLLCFTFCTGHCESLSRSLLVHVPDEEHGLLQSLQSTWWVPLLHDQSGQHFSETRPFQTISVCTFAHWKMLMEAWIWRRNFCWKRPLASWLQSEHNWGYSTLNTKVTGPVNFQEGAYWFLRSF